MTSNAILIAALVLLPAFGLVAWAWFAMAQVEDDMRSSSGFEGLDFDIGPEASVYAKGAR